jgi:putative alpha-1,2-mannosidase
MRSHHIQILTIARHVFPGANIPFGLAKPGPDTNSSNNQAGYYPTGYIKGFSQLHSDGVSVSSLLCQHASFFSYLTV